MATRIDIVTAGETPIVKLTNSTGSIEIKQNSTNDKLEIDNWIFTDPMWDDLRFPANSLNPLGTEQDADVDTTTTFLGTLLFASAAIEVCVGVAQFPHRWLEGSAVHPHIHWAPTSTNTGNVLWQLDYQLANINGTFPGTWTTLQVLDAADGTTDKHQIAELGVIDMTGYTLSCMMCWKLSRIGDDATDTYTADARLFEFDIHFQSDADGSRQEYIK